MFAKITEFLSTSMRVAPYNMPVSLPLIHVIEDKETLTKKEIKEGYEIDPVLGKINVRKALKERSEAIRSEYEAFDLMHSADGTFSKSSYSL